MADTKISALPASTTPLAGTEVLPIVQSSSTKQVSVANLTAGRAISATQLTLTTGNLIVANGQGVDFSATPGTGTSELLADYEEGTFTIAFAADSGSITLNAATMLYTKVGRLVTCTGYITVTSVSSPIGTLYFSGLPFTSNSASPAGIAGFSVSGAGWSANAATQVYGYVSNNLTEGVIGGLTVSTGANVPFAAYINSSTFLRLSIVYTAA